MKKYFTLLFLSVVLSATRSTATTWDEPWADRVIKEATSFVLAKVVTSHPEKGLKILVIHTLAGKPLTDTILITNFYLLKLCSTSGGHGAEFRTDVADSCYFFLKQNNKGEYCIATPTTGFDYVNKQNVVATFRHSYHQASVPIEVYEKMMTAIYHNYHGLAYDKEYVNKFVLEQLQKKPAGFSKEEISAFFLQHVALESVYHLKLQIPEQLLLPFFNDLQNFHHQVSAARALRAFNSEGSRRHLLSAIADTTRSIFVRVLCVWSLTEMNPSSIKSQLKRLELTATDENEDFGGNIMDPRVCTHMPSLKKALKDLIAKTEDK